MKAIYWIILTVHCLHEANIEYRADKSWRSFWFAVLGSLFCSLSIYCYAKGV